MTAPRVLLAVAVVAIAGCAALLRDLADSFRQEDVGDFRTATDRTYVYPQLVLSGGGAYGAFGAGFLQGWTRAGTRPVFKIVTGLSTGALIAPFVFVGAHYDHVLERLYTTTSSPQIFVFRSMLRWLGSESLADTAPLDALIADNVDDELVRAVARVHERGRRHYLGTVQRCRARATNASTLC